MWLCTFSTWFPSSTCQCQEKVLPNNEWCITLYWGSLWCIFCWLLRLPDLVACYSFQKEYIHRVGRTARGINGRGHALLILRPEELGFLRYLKQARVSFCLHLGFFTVHLFFKGKTCWFGLFFQSSVSFWLIPEEGEPSSKGNHFNRTAQSFLVALLMDLFCDLWLKWFNF